MKRTYAQLLKDRDNFIMAAIMASNDFMKMLWIKRAEYVVSQIMKLQETDVFEINKESKGVKLC